MRRFSSRPASSSCRRLRGIDRRGAFWSSLGLVYERLPARLSDPDARNFNHTSAGSNALGLRCRESARTWKGASTPASVARKYEPEFPNELYMQWYRLYDIPVPDRGKPWHFKYLTVNHIYYPLAQSSGKILTLLRAHKSRGGDRAKKLFQFLNEIGARALRMHLGRVLEMAESSSDKWTYERKVAERFGGQQEFEFVTPAAPVQQRPEAAN